MNTGFVTRSLIFPGNVIPPEFQATNVKFDLLQIFGFCKEKVILINNKMKLVHRTSSSYECTLKASRQSTKNIVFILPLIFAWVKQRHSFLMQTLSFTVDERN